MTDEQNQPRMYSEDEVKHLVDLHVSYMSDLKGVDFQRREFDEDLTNEAIKHREGLLFPEITEKVYRWIFPNGVHEEFEARLKAKGIDTTHLE